jgi:putative NIF3 family GTP cyclohydrolase 1 type 2
VGIACGSAGSFLPHARRAGCQLFITGETSFHSCLEAEALGIALLLPGHYASERFGVEALAGEIQNQFPVLEVWASRVEQDPLTWS